MVSIARPTRIASMVSPSPLPVWLYAINGVFPIAICLRHQLWWAAGLGAAAMTIPIAFAIAAPRRARAATRALPGRATAPWPASPAPGD